MNECVIKPSLMYNQTKGVNMVLFSEKRKDLLDFLDYISDGLLVGAKKPSIEINEDLLSGLADEFSGTRELRSMVSFFLTNRNPPKNIGFNDYPDVCDYPSGAAFKLYGAIRDYYDKHSLYFGKKANKFLQEIFMISEEFAFEEQKHDMIDMQVVEVLESMDKRLSDIEKSHSEIQKQILKAEEIKKEVGGIRIEVDKSLRTQKIDALAMTTLVFTAFTVLAVNASIIAGIGLIKEISIYNMILLFVSGNLTVLAGIGFSYFLMNKIVNR